jgi:hypothetical protein
MRRPEEYAESRRRLQVSLERAYLQTTPMGMFVVAYVESAVDYLSDEAGLARSDLDIDKYFREHIQEVHGFDVTQPPPGPPPETIGVWADPDVTERRPGMGFTAPLLPGSEDGVRAWVKNTYSRPEMTESRRALGQDLEVATLISTPQGPVCAVYLEGKDSFEANRRFAASTSPFDVWFKEDIKQFFPPFIDFNQPVEGVEQVFDSQEILART